MEIKQSSFLALLSRMDRVVRWNKSRPSLKENLNDHSLHVAFICLLIGIKRKQLNVQPYIDPYELAMFGAFHDCSEALSEDINGRYKKVNKATHRLFKIIEADACDNLIHSLPDEFQDELKLLLRQDLADKTIKDLVKAADILHALTKIGAELGAGCQDFAHAKIEQTNMIQRYLDEYPEVKYVYDHFIQNFSCTFDELIDQLPERNELPEGIE
ncbi:Nucleotidase YfbR, HD superfamily [Vibrio chagasii]|nr:Nucleotidase YfbR, HD superfamily [Vibrio chagasii]